MNVAIEELKQRITAITAKVRRYKGRVDSYRQNRLFGNNQRQFYKKDAEWLQEWLQVNVKKQEKISITTRCLKKILGRMPIWKSPGPDLVQGF